MFFRLLLLFTLIPLAELYLLFQIAEVIGGWRTFALVIATGALGAGLAKHEGLRTLGRIQSELNEGRLPGDSLIDGLLILIAGIVLITPGIMTDALGLLLLMPPVRTFVRNRLRKHYQGRFSIVDMSRLQRPSAPADGDLVDVDAREVDESDRNGP